MKISKFREFKLKHPYTLSQNDVKKLQSEIDKMSLDKKYEMYQYLNECARHGENIPLLSEREAYFADGQIYSSNKSTPSLIHTAISGISFGITATIYHIATNSATPEASAGLLLAFLATFGLGAGNAIIAFNEIEKSFGKGYVGPVSKFNKRIVDNGKKKLANLKTYTLQSYRENESKLEIEQNEPEKVEKVDDRQIVQEPEVVIENNQNIEKDNL